MKSDFVFSTPNALLDEGEVTWEAPSNIALIKYWGKKENQIPTNPSLSFTLNNCKTKTTLHFSKKVAAHNFSFSVFFEGKENTAFKPKIKTFFKRIEAYLPFLKNYHFTIQTTNTFPHSSGIASSASGMAALALCLMSIEKQLQPEMPEDYFYKKASFLARLGSGSACRSIQGEIVVWGEHNQIPCSSNLYGISYSGSVHDNFKNYQDTILLVETGKKQVSSTLGHQLMQGHPFAAQRFKQAQENLLKLTGVLQTGNLKEFINITETEALSLHAMMLTSNPYFILMKPNTLQIIEKIWAYRNKTQTPISFTLDAGANVHILYPSNCAKACLEFIKNELVAYCQNRQYICDTVGNGAKQIA